MADNSASSGGSFLLSTRAVMLDLIGIWIAIAFLRLFVVENYRIPTSSMTPTLVGGSIAELDWDDDGDMDYILAFGSSYTVFSKEGEGYDMWATGRLAADVERRFEKARRQRHDNILVNKFQYWLCPPHRGEIAVFKPPQGISTREAPIYVKRIVGEPGETVSIVGDRLHVNGFPVEDPSRFLYQQYDRRADRWGPAYKGQTLGDHEYLFFGDNTLNSSDGRNWGGVPTINIKGKVFFRYWPLDVFGFVR